MMRLADGSVWATLAVVTFSQFSGASAADQPRSPGGAPPAPVLSEAPVAPALVGKSLVSGEPSPPARRRIGESDRTTDADAADQGIAVEAPSTEVPVVRHPRLGTGRYGVGGRSARHERLRARRLMRIQQLRQSADENGDTQGAEQAQYLEGMVNELHDQGLFSFAQKLVGAIQEGKLQGMAAGADTSSGKVEMPEADLGSSAPLPDSDLGEPAPLPGITDDAPPAND